MSNIEEFLTKIPGRNDEPRDIIPYVTQSGDLGEVVGVDTIVQSIKRVLLTARRTYPFDPNFGSNLYKMVFEPADTITRQSIENEIRSAIMYYKTDATISFNVRFFTNQKGFAVNLLIYYRGKTRRISLPIDETLLKSMDD
jgi:phage baseplate assembly protein W